MPLFDTRGGADPLRVEGRTTRAWFFDGTAG
jgi:hypothetical protein